MNQLEVFFDYACPFCYTGHEYLKEITEEYPQLQIVWCPCEAHPRPEKYGPHSDLCIRGMFYAADCGIDLWKYHDLMYKAALGAKYDIEKPDILAEVVSEIFEPKTFSEILKSEKYKNELIAANQRAWEEMEFSAVPSFIMNGEKLESVENIGVTKNRLKSFIFSKNN